MGTSAAVRILCDRVHSPSPSQHVVTPARGPQGTARRHANRIRGRAASREPDPGQLRYVSDLQFVDEPAPAEPVWTAH
jgi:hypothetical protein